MKRLVVYVPVELLRRLKATLALRGLTMSEWFRRIAQDEIDGSDVDGQSPSI